MSETPAIRGVVLSHGELAAGIVDAVRQITGMGEDVLVPLSNRGKSPETLQAAVAELVGEGPAIVFTDLQSGSCGIVARRLSQQAARVVVVSGMNLPVLLEFVTNRHLPLDALVPRLLQKGRAAICCAPNTLEPA